MSRIVYNEDYFDEYDMLRAGGFEANMRKAIRGARGQKLLKELEAALLALPEKRLIREEFAVSEAASKAWVVGFEHPKPEPGVCALGCLVLKRKMDEGMTREQAVAWMEEKFGHELDPNESMDLAAENLRMTRCLAWVIMEANDEFAESMTPEQRYEYVLDRVRKMIKSPEVLA